MRPVVLALANDPVGSSLVAKLSRPGGNITGLSLQTPDVAGKRLELLRELLPGVRRLALGSLAIPVLSRLAKSDNGRRSSRWQRRSRFAKCTRLAEVRQAR